MLKRIRVSGFPLSCKEELEKILYDQFDRKRGIKYELEVNDEVEVYITNIKRADFARGYLCCLRDSLT